MNDLRLAQPELMRAERGDFLMALSIGWYSASIINLVSFFLSSIVAHVFLSRSDFLEIGSYYQNCCNIPSLITLDTRPAFKLQLI